MAASIFAVAAIAIVIDSQHFDGIELWMAALMASGAVALFWILRPLLIRLAPKKHLPRWAAALAGVVILFLIANVGEGGDYVLQQTLTILAGSSLLLWVASWIAVLDRIIRFLFWGGFVYLLGSALLLPWTSAGPFHSDTKALHALIGFVWTPFFLVYLVNHVVRYDSKSQDRIRTHGYAAAVLLTLGVLAGVTHLLLGPDSWASSTELHVLASLAALVPSVLHLHRKWAMRGLRPRWVDPIPVIAKVGMAGTLLLLCFGLLWPIVDAPSPEVATGTFAWSPEEVETHLANPRTGLTVTSAQGGGIPEEMLVVHSQGQGCGESASCHREITEQWERSAHRFAANPAYRTVVRALVEEEGVEAARLCASCHDPVTLLAGQIIPGYDYPYDDSNGVTCAVCHGLIIPDEPLETLGNGRYQVQAHPNELLHRRYPLVGYMMIKDNLDAHQAAWSPPSIKTPNACAPCHNLSLNGVHLRDTFSDFVQTEPQETCLECHMPLQDGSDIGGGQIHNHEFPGGNVAITRLYEGGTEDVVRFIAKALEIRVEPEAPDKATVILANIGSGHGFPAAPKDMIGYWFEARWQTDQGDAAWARIGPSSLFHHTLTDRSGAVIEKHHIWRVAAFEGPEMIPAGGEREYRLTVGAPPRPDARLELRLMHQRFHEEALRAELRDSELFLEPVEILRDPPLPDPERDDHGEHRSHGEHRDERDSRNDNMHPPGERRHNGERR